MSRILRSLIALAALVSVLGLSGCVTIIGQTEAQTDTIGDVRISTTICVSRDPNAQGATCPDTNSNTGIDAGYADGQVLVAYRVPAAALAPDTIDMAYTSGDIGSLTLSRNESYSDQMN